MERKIALITGAASGLGLETTLELAKNKYVVIATVRSLDRCDELIDQCQKNTLKNVHIKQLDVTDNDQINNVIREVQREFGGIDILINNAGFAMAGFAEELSITEWKQQFDTNVFGLIMVTRAVLPLMRSKGEGRIIQISSISGKVPFPGLSAYCASKHAVEAYNESLRLEVKPFGIHVTSIIPGSFQTNIWTKGKRIAEESKLESSPYHRQLTKMEQYIEKSKLTFGNANDVAKLIVKVLSQRSPRVRYYIGRNIRLSLLFYRLVPNVIWEKLIEKRM